MVYGHKKLHVPLPFETIMQRHEREIMRYLLRVSSDPEDAADLFQETGFRRTAPILDLSPKATLSRGCMRSRATYAAIGRVTVRAARARSYPIPRSLPQQTQLEGIMAPFMKTKLTQPSIYAR